MLNKELMVKAHKLAKEIKAEYPEVNYKVQLGLCISYLLEEKGEVEMSKKTIRVDFDHVVTELEVMELVGTEKQVEWGNKYRKETIESFLRVKKSAESKDSFYLKNTFIKNKEFFRTRANGEKVTLTFVSEVMIELLDKAIEKAIKINDAKKVVEIRHNIEGGLDLIMAYYNL